MLQTCVLSLVDNSQQMSVGLVAQTSNFLWKHITIFGYKLIDYQNILTHKLARLACYLSKTFQQHFSVITTTQYTKYTLRLELRPYDYRNSIIVVVTIIMPHPHTAGALSDDARLTSVCRVHQA